MFSHFSSAAQTVLSAAQAGARALGHDQLGLEHLLLGLLRAGGDLPLPPGIQTATTLDAALAGLLESGSGGKGQLKATPEAVAAIARAEGLMAARHESEVRPPHLLVAVLEGGATGTRLADLLAQAGVDVAAWRAGADTALQEMPAGRPAPAEAGGRGTPHLDRYGRDLTALARQGALAPVFGREPELRALIEVLCKMEKNNPALVGEPGVGKTALVEGLAQRMAAGRVPYQLQGRRLVALDLNSMVAGTRYRGDFEERLNAVLEETGRARAVLFIDEMHTVVGAGDGEGRTDLANVLKPYLTRGTISVIGATTTAEYRRHIERDGALERRFQPLIVEEPSAEATLQILKNLRPRFETHYRAMISDVVLQQVVDLCGQYLRHRYFPDKAIDVLQLAGARAQLDNLPDAVAAQRAIDGEPLPVAGPEDAPVVVSPDHVRAVVAELAGVPLDHFAGSPILAKRYLAMEAILGAEIFGQDDAVAAVANALRLAKRQLDLNPLRPDGVFLFLGPPGVGKTALSRALGRFLFGDERHVIRLDMSEFTEPHSIARLIGSPPGYVGYDEGGQLTEKIRSQPFSLLVLDELEKAHPAVINLFLQVCDEGHLSDARGRTVYFSDVTVVLTSHAGADHFAGRAIGFTPGRAGGVALAGGARPVSEESALNEARKHFPSELLSRLDKVILFGPLSRDAARRIVAQKLDATLSRISEAPTAAGGPAAVTVTYDPALVDYVVDRGFSVEWGARHVERAVEEHVLAPLALATFRPDWPAVRTVHLTLGADGLVLLTNDR